MNNKNPKSLPKIAILFIIIGCIAITGCIFLLCKNIFYYSTFQPTTQNLEDKSFDSFEEIEDDIFKTLISEDSLALHYYLKNPENYGITKSSENFSDFSIEKNEEYLEYTNFILDELEKIDTSTLSIEDQINYDYLYRFFSLDTFISSHYLYSEPLSVELGEHINLPISFSNLSLSSEKDVEDYLDILESFDETIDSIIEFETNKYDAGLFMSDEAADMVIEQCDAFVNSSDNILVSSFNERINTIDLSTSKKNEYIKRNADIVENEVFPAYDTLTSSLLTLKGSGNELTGVCNLPNGKEYYEKTVQQNTGSSKTIPEIKEMLLQAQEDSLNEFIEIYQNDPTIFERMENPSYPSTDPKTCMDILQKEMIGYFPESDEIKYNIVYSPEALIEYLSPATCYVPAIDDYNESTISINAKKGEEPADIFTKLAHEGFPGHLYQLCYYASQEKHPVIQILKCSGYTEGWATYAEMRSYSMAGFDDNLANALRCDDAYSSYMCCLMDIGVGYEGWTKDDLAAFLAENGIENEETCDFYYRLLCQTPGYYLDYLVGYLEILEFKDVAIATLGNDFDEKSFHKYLLELGPVNSDLYYKYSDSLYFRLLTKY